MIHRRDFLARSALGASFLPVGIAFAGPFVNEAKAETSTIVKSEMTLAVQTWTFRLFNIDEAIRKTRQVGVDAVEISGGIKIAGQGKRASSMTPEERERLKDVLRESQVRIVSLGGSRGTVEEFEFAVEFGCTVMQGEPPFENLVEISKRAEEYKIRFALHNHAHPNKYWNYQETQKRLEDCTPWLGFCPDTGHMMRSGIDPLQAIKDLSGKIFSIHLKDLNDMNPLEGDKKPLHDVPWGTGKGQVEAILRELDRQKFAGPVIIEYEYNWENNLEEVKACADFFSECIAKR